jgi:hypothetical protein
MPIATAVALLQPARWCIEASGMALYLGRGNCKRSAAPMTTFNDRENAFEAKFAHDAELEFKVAARRDKLIGLWAAEKLGLDAMAAEAYAKQVILSDLEEPGDEDVIRKLVADLAGVGIDEPSIRAALADHEVVARQQILAAN